MITQCPHCSTAFNVVPEQLFARDGRVRCGNCRQVFDGLVHLTSMQALQAGVAPARVDEPPAPVPAAAASAPVASAVEPAPAPTPSPAPAHGFSPVNWATLPAVPQVPQPLPAAVVQAPSTAPAEPAPAVAAAAVILAPAADAAPALFEQPFRPIAAARPRRRWPWALAASFAAVALAGQVVYAFRSEIAAYFPRLKQPLAALCELADCRVLPLQKPSVLAIQASDLLIVDPAMPHRVQLIVTLENQSNVEVGYPAIDLVLNDSSVRTLSARNVLIG
ncbi:MAG: DUF3426 domain-containing protein [Betaproteobacteria bacterium]|nr:DUF3426 domain-containing protein [Betaproteobacteria bacterium]